MGVLSRNLRIAFRQLRKTPGFSLAVILNLAVGIGATTAIFSLIQGILLRPLPFERPDRLVLIGDTLGGSRGTGITAREINTYSTATGAFSSMGAFSGASYELSGGPLPEEIHAARLNATVFPTLGTQPILGRVFTVSEEAAHQPVAVISYSLWSTRFQLDPQVLGRTLLLDRRPYTIIGVMPRSFEFPLQPGLLNQAELWVPISLTAQDLDEEHAGAWTYQMVARMRDGVTLSQATEDVRRVARQIMQGFPATMSAIHIEGKVSPLGEQAVADARPLLRTLLMAVLIILLIACVNAAGLLLVRAIRRQREYAVRLALGASSGVILRESIGEGLLLSLAGGLMGLGLAAAVVRITLHLLPESMPRVNSISIDGSVVGFALLLALITGALCSLAPAFAALRTSLTGSLNDGAKSRSAAASHSWLRTALVVVEIAIALVLLSVSGAFLRSFQKMLAVDPGFRADHVLVASYQLPLNQYATKTSADSFNREVLDRLRAKPGVQAVGITDFLPASDLWRGAAYTVEGVSAERWKLQFAMLAFTYGDYFQAMRIPLIEGRYFTARDRADAPLAVIVNQTMAKQCWPGTSPIGKRIHQGNPKKGLPWATVVGVVANTKFGSRDLPDSEQWYAPAEQPALIAGPGASNQLSNAAGGYITVRSALPPEQMIETLRSTVAEVDPLLGLDQVQPMAGVLAKIEAPRRFNTGLITAFAACALLLAISGISAVVAFSASTRTQEIAVRMALGAQRGRIARMVLVSGARMALLGCALGVLGSLAAARLVRSFLFEVSATDPMILVAAVVVMMVMAAVASAIPAMRAAATDPIEALRAI